MELVEAIVLAVLAASTPLLIAATGELVTERAGVLNLGVEGMMIVGAACGFASVFDSSRSRLSLDCGVAGGVLARLGFATAFFSAGAFGVSSDLVISALA